MFNQLHVRSLSALILALFTIMLLDELALLFIAIVGLLLLWIFAISYTKATAPSVILGNLLAIGCTVGLFMTLGTDELVNLFLAMLLQANCLKLLVSEKENQIKSVVLINFFLSSCVFLFYQSLPATLFVLLLFLINILALYLLTNEKLEKQTSLQAIKLLALSLPIAAVLFLFVPKLPSFWRMPNLSSAQVGLSESVNPFNISDLTKSDKLAFRAEVPAAIQGPFYWRTMIHEDYDGKSWNINYTANHIIESLKSDAPDNQIKIYHEKTNLKWLPSLYDSISDTPNISTTINGSLVRNRPNNQAFVYQFSPLPKNKWLNQDERDRNLRLPEDLNPSTIQLAATLANNASSTEHFIRLLAEYYLSKGFTYTLKPPTYSNESSIDQFIFTGKQGFCGHYASGSAFIFRAAGIRARVVSGYLGGEAAANDDYVSIYQYDAHAWVEVWVQHKGWTKFDATEFVAPDRLHGSLSQLDETREQFEDNVGLGLTTLSQIRLFNEIRLYLSELDYQWTIWVLNFDNEAQKTLIAKLIKDANPMKIAILVFSVIGLVLALLLVTRMWQGRVRYQDKVAYLLVSLENFAKEQGIERQAGQTVAQFIAQLAEHLPNKKQPLNSFLTLYSRYRYGEKTLTRAQFIALRQNLKTIKDKKTI